MPRQERLKRLEPHLEELSRAGLQVQQWSQDPLVLGPYSTDLWPRKLLELRDRGPEEPTIELVLWPESAQQVSQVLQWAARADAVLYPYGAGSGVCGATVAAENETRPRVVVDLKRMRQVRSIDRVSMTAWVEAGIIGENLERHLNQEGYTLGHFPSSIYCSSLGGYLATRSAGQLSTKYGKIEDLVVSVEFVLPDGTIAETGRAPRSAMGPDWTQLLLGTEGTLGFFTAALLQIHPLPKSRVCMSWAARDVVQATAFARTAMQEGLRPAVLRIYDPLETSMALNSKALQEAHFPGGAAMVAVFEGNAAIVAAEVAEAKALASRMELTDLGPSLGEHWWKHRYDVSYKQQLILSHQRMILDTFELAATWDRLDAVYRAVKSVSAGMGMIMAHYSHFYHTGANIYFTLVSHAGFSKSSPERYDEIWEGMMKAAFEAGATLSHHHGAGALKRKWIQKEKGAFQPLYQKVKRAFDPENRLNPDKMGL